MALAWMWMFARAMRVEYIEGAIWWVLPVSVWCVYVLDRLVDSWRNVELRASSPRHQFHWKWRWLFLVLVFAAAATCFYHALFVLSRSTLSAGLVAMLICGLYFLMVIFRTKEVPYIKNFMAGMIFAMGVGIPVNAANANLQGMDIYDVVYAFYNTGWGDAAWNLFLMVLNTLGAVFVGCKEVCVFGLLCMMNITAIDLWERAAAARDEETAYSHESTLTLGLFILAAGALLFAAMEADVYAKPFYYSIMVAAALMQGLNHYRERFSLNALRVLADVALIVPLPIFLVT
ncbi:MAG: hypothetical protein ACSHX0_01555 [Akkermansiaceae bacterium]